MRRALTAGKRGVKLFGTELTLDTGKMFAVHGQYAGGRFTFVARLDTYTISLLADEGLAVDVMLTAGKREDKLISTELTLDSGKKLQSLADVDHQ